MAREKQLKMRPFRVTDDYVEVSAIPDRAMVELYVTWPGSDRALSAHLHERLAWRLGVWLIFWWIRDRLCGWRSRQEEKKHRRLLLELEEDNISP